MRRVSFRSLFFLSVFCYLRDLHISISTEQQGGASWPSMQQQQGQRLF